MLTKNGKNNYLKRETMSTQCKSVFDNPVVAAGPADLHDAYVVVPADKASNNIVTVCKGALFENIRLKSYIFMYFVVEGGNSE